jgi:hypothetical protein
LTRINKRAKIKYTMLDLKLVTRKEHEQDSV